MDNPNRILFVFRTVQQGVIARQYQMSTSLEDRVAQLVRDLGGRNTEDVLCALRSLASEAVGPLASALDREPVVTLGGPPALKALENGGATVAGLPDAQVRLEWMQEALEQMRSEPLDG
jgi:hypothetical protein